MPQSAISASASPNPGRGGHAPAQGGVIATLIEAVRRQETLIDALTAAVDSGNEKAILEAARNLAANRRKEIPAPSKQRGRKPKESYPRI